MFKCMNGLAPTTLNNNLNFVNDSHSYVTRASVQDDLILPNPNCEIFRQSFMYLGHLSGIHYPVTSITFLILLSILLYQM